MSVEPRPTDEVIEETERLFSVLVEEQIFTEQVLVVIAPQPGVDKWLVVTRSRLNDAQVVAVLSRAIEAAVTRLVQNLNKPDTGLDLWLRNCD